MNEGEKVFGSTLMRFFFFTVLLSLKWATDSQVLLDQETLFGECLIFKHFM